MECPYTGQIGVYLDGELDADQRRALEAHLPSCAACSRETGEVRSLKALFAAAEYPALSGRAVERLHDQAESLYERGTLRIARALSGLAACLLIAGSLWLTQSQTPPDTRAEVQPSSVAAAYTQADPLIPVEVAEQVASGVQTAADPASPEWVVNDLNGLAGTASDEEVR